VFGPEHRDDLRGGCPQRPVALREPAEQEIGRPGVDRELVGETELGVVVIEPLGFARLDTGRRGQVGDGSHQRRPDAIRHQVPPVHP
jgi:hypothetical protein